MDVYLKDEIKLFYCSFLVNYVNIRTEVTPDENYVPAASRHRPIIIINFGRILFVFCHDELIVFFFFIHLIK